MKNTDLDSLLDTLRRHGVVSAEVPTTLGALRVVFGPDGALPAGDPVTQGGWKSPERLDAPEQFEELP